MRINSKYILFIVVLINILLAAYPAEAHWGYGVRWYPDHRPYIIERHHYVYPDVSIARAREYIAVGKAKINHGKWLIRNGYYTKGKVEIAEGRHLIYLGNRILRR